MHAPVGDAGLLLALGRWTDRQTRCTLGPTQSSLLLSQQGTPPSCPGSHCPEAVHLALSCKETPCGSAGISESLHRSVGRKRSPASASPAQISSRLSCWHLRILRLFSFFALYGAEGAEGSCLLPCPAACLPAARSRLSHQDPQLPPILVSCWEPPGPGIVLHIPCFFEALGLRQGCRAPTAGLSSGCRKQHGTARPKAPGHGAAALGSESEVLRWFQTLRRRCHRYSRLSAVGAGMIPAPPPRSLAGVPHISSLQNVPSQFFPC